AQHPRERVEVVGHAVLQQRRLEGPCLGNLALQPLQPPVLDLLPLATDQLSKLLLHDCSSTSGPATSMQHAPAFTATRRPMSYTVLARKYRPQTFEEMTGQEHVVKTVENALKLDRVAHAYLFCGPRGVGKTTAARLLARALNCEKGPTPTPCGVCKACVEIRDGTSTDVSEIDGASNNGVENVREIRENAKYLPQGSRHKIYIIDEVHMLSGAAFNALLKTLEEPPGHVKFIFATTEPQKLPDTIVSRCQRHNFRRISAAAMLKRLKEICALEKVQVSDRSLALIVRQSEGGMRDALSLVDQVLSACGTSPTDAEVAEALGAIDRTLV